MNKRIYIDTETTSLLEDRETWEWALIEEDGTEHVFMCWVYNPLDIDPKAAKINGIYDRSPQWNNNIIDVPLWGHPSDPDHDMHILADTLWQLTRDATLVGICPDFDADNLKQLLRGEGYPPAWDHDLLDARTLARGFALGQRTGPTYDMTGRFGGVFERNIGWKPFGIENQAPHTALGDARYARDLITAIEVSV